MIFKRLIHHSDILCIGIVIIFYFILYSTCEAGVLHCDSIPGCIVDGGWSQWGPWSECSALCGGGVTLRIRQCNNPAPQGGGRECSGGADQQKECNRDACTGV